MYWFIDGVPLFFMLSGYLVFRSCHKCFETGQPLGHFYWNRLLRVVPAIYLYILAVTIWLILIGVIQAKQLFTGQYLSWLGLNLSLMGVGSPPIFQSFGIGVINGSLWTIPVEVSFYVVIPLFVMVWRKAGATFGTWVLVLAALVGLLLRWLIFLRFHDGLATKVVDVTLAPYMLWFVLGILVGQNWKRLSHSWVWFVTSVVVYFAIRWIWFDYRETAGPVYDVAFGLPLAYMVFWIGFNGWKKFNLLTRPGDVSYGIYIWHMIVVNSLLYFGAGSNLQGYSKLAMVLLTIAVTYLIGLASWLLVEKRALRMKPYTSRPAESRVSEA